MDKQKIKIRYAREEDRKRIIEICLKAFNKITWHYKLEQKYGIIGGRKWNDWKASEVKNADLKNFIVACQGNKIVGFASFGFEDLRKIGVVENNAVDPEYAGRGIGTKMIKKVLEILKRKGMILAKVTTGLNDDYIPARKMYEKVGFEPLWEAITYFKKL